MKPNTYCTHEDCRAHTAEELQFIAESIRRSELSAKVANIAQTKVAVRCRHVPRKGPSVNAPLPGDFSTVAKATS